MSNVYSLDGIPSDVITGLYGDRKLKVSGTFQSSGQSALEPLSKKEFAWNADGTLESITITDKESGNKIKKSFSYDANGDISNIDVSN